MKPRIMAVALLFAVFLFAPAALQAQMAGQLLFHADIPFPFTAAGTHLPAGHYFVSHPGDPNLVIVQKDDYRARAVLYVHVSEASAKAAGTKLVFNKYGDRHFLSQVWTEGDRETHATLKCKAEQRLAEAFEKPTVVAILAKP